jgi:hypothetical protein
MVVFNLNQNQIELAKNLANKIKNSKAYTNSWNEDKIALGIYGEIAYGLMVGKDINTEVWTDRGDGGSDFNDGVDVKTISYSGPDPELKIGRLPLKYANKKLVLAICEQKENDISIKLVGEISMAHFISKATKRHYGDRSWYAVGKDDLDILY